MAGNADNLLLKIGDPGSATTLDANYTAGDTTVTVASTANWTTTGEGVIFAMDMAEVVNGVERQIAGTYNEFEGTVASATSITNVDWVRGAGDTDYDAGALTRVYIPVSAERENRIVDWGSVDHSLNGTHEIASNYDPSNPTLETQKWVGVSSAVNELTVTNSATGNPVPLSATGGDTNIDLNLVPKGTGDVQISGVSLSAIRSEMEFDYIASGGVWSGDSYAASRNASMTALVCYINGQRGTVSAVTARAFTASKDTYVDILNTAGVFSLVYTEVANNAASPALAANSIRLAIIVTDATDIQDVGSINQGEQNKVLPVASNNYYTVTDSLGNLICPRDPNRKILGFRRMTSTFTVSSASASLVTNANGTLSVPVIVPTGRKVRVSAYSEGVKYATATGSAYMSVHPTSVGTTRIINAACTSATASASVPANPNIIHTPSSTSMTYVCGLAGDSGAVVSTLAANSTAPAYIMVELV